MITTVVLMANSPPSANRFSQSEVINRQGGSEYRLESYDIKNGTTIGEAYIFSNDEFDDGTIRDGNEHDLEGLKRLLPKMGFPEVVKNVNLFENLTVSNMNQKLKEISENRNHSEPSCLLMVFLSHGRLDQIKMKDGRKDIAEIVDKFAENQCEYLHKKPKIFIFQVCRGRKVNTGVHVPGINTQNNSSEDEESDVEAFDDKEEEEEDDDEDQKVFIPIGADVMCCYPTLPHYKSYRNLETGSRFIRTLVQVIEAYVEDTGSTSKIDFASLMTLVASEVAEITKRDQKTGQVKKQMPWYYSTFRKKLYFPLFRNNDNRIFLDQPDEQSRVDTNEIAVPSLEAMQ